MALALVLHAHVQASCQTHWCGPPLPCLPSFHQTQTFNATANQATSSLLFLSCIGIIIPTAATQLSPGEEPEEWILRSSRGTAVVLLAIYACYLVGKRPGTQG